MELKEQLYVCKLAEYGSVTAAAKKLFISQPALSMYINNVENRLGTKLFNRINNKYILTYAGELYVEKAKKMLELQDEFREGLEGIVRGYDYRIRVGIQMRRSPYLVANILTKVKGISDKIKVEITESVNQNLERMLLESKLDLILYNSEIRKNQIKYEHLLDDQLLVALPVYSDLRQHGKWIDNSAFQWIDIRHLREETFILPFKRQSLRDTVEILLSSSNIIPREIIEIRNIKTIMQLVSNGFGVGFNRQSYINHMKDVENLTYFLVGPHDKSCELAIAYLDGIERSDVFFEIVNIIKEIFNENK